MPASPCRPARRGLAFVALPRRGLAAWLLAMLLVPLLCLPPAAQAEDRARATPDLRTVDTALFSAPGMPTTRVALPDTWAHRDVPVDTPGRYRMEFSLDDLPDESLALAFHRLSTHHRVYVNGVLVAGREQGPAQANPRAPVPTLVAVPPTFVRVGWNTVDVEVEYRMRAGLSAMEVGPMSSARPIHHARVQAQVALPQALNMASGGLAVFMLAIWWRRRQEVALGTFGGLMLLGSVRNYAYFLDTAIGGAWLGDWLFFCAQIVSVVLLGTFAQAFAGVRWPRYRRLLHGTLVVFGIVGAVAAAQEEVQRVRAYAYPWLLLLCLPVLWLCLRKAWSEGTRALVGQVAGVTAMLVAVTHDYAMQTANWLPVTEVYWLPFVMPVALGLFSLALLGRMVKALGEVEALNAQLEARVAERTRELELANAAKTRFLASASHDLRQPLVTIGLLIGLVKDRREAQPMRSMLERVDEAVGAMEGLLTGLLDLSQLESGTVTPVRAPIRVADLFNAIELHEQPAAALKGLRLRFRPTDAVVESDPVMLERIVRNLVSNAVRYTGQGGVLVAVRRRADALRIEVRDSGAGIPDEHRERIFQEFVQLDHPVRDRTRGLGLGLAIVQRSAALLGHRIGLRSQPGKGSCFWIEVPRAQLAPARSRPAPGMPTLAGRHAVLVEDDGAVRMTMTERLSAWGAVVHPCGSLQGLREWMAGAGRDVQVELLVSDYRLPDGDGLEVLATVRERWPGARALLVTGDTATHDLARLQSAGVPVLHKPFRTEALGEVLRALWESPPPAHNGAPSRSAGTYTPN